MKFNEEKLISFLKEYKIDIKNINHYITAFTHGSFTPNNKTENYQTLEFLGDAILQFLLSDFIYKKFKNKKQGELSLIRSKFARTETLNKLSEKLHLKDYLIIGTKYPKEQILNSEKVGADIFESFLAAIYLDSGLKVAYSFLKNTLFKYVETLNQKTSLKDYKTMFQEEVQALNKKGVIYNTYAIENNLFKSEAIYDGIIFGIGIGKNKMLAEEEAANVALQKLIKKK